MGTFLKVFTVFNFISTKYAFSAPDLQPMMPWTVTPDEAILTPFPCYMPIAYILDFNERWL
jgi:hypothetical protein